MSYPKILHCLLNTKASFTTLFMPCFNLWMRCNIVILGDLCKQPTLQQRGREIISVLKSAPYGEVESRNRAKLLAM